MFWSELGRDALACARSERRVSRAQLLARWDDVNGRALLRAGPGMRNPSWVRSGSSSGWERVGDEERVLEEGARVRLLRKGPELVVRVEGGRRVKYGREEEEVEPESDRMMVECVYGVKCAKQEDAQHMSLFRHSEKKRKTEEGGLGNEARSHGTALPDT